MKQGNGRSIKWSRSVASSTLLESWKCWIIQPLMMFKYFRAQFNDFISKSPNEFMSVIIGAYRSVTSIEFLFMILRFICVFTRLSRAPLSEVRNYPFVCNVAKWKDALVMQYEVCSSSRTLVLPINNPKQYIMATINPSEWSYSVYFNYQQKFQTYHGFQ